MAEFDVTLPVTEIELAEAMSQDTHNPVGVLRRLAFQRDGLLAELAAAEARAAKAEGLIEKARDHIERSCAEYKWDAEEALEILGGRGDAAISKESEATL